MLSTEREFVFAGFDSWMTTGLFAIVMVFALTTLAWSQEHDMDSMPGMHMNGPAVCEDPAQQAKHFADKKESEFNHHLAGWLVIVAGLFILSESYLSKPLPLVKYTWPLCFIAAGLFVLIFSDTEIWPFGPQTPWYALSHNGEDLQHKIFAIILLAIGYVEFQRARGRLKAPWAAWFFPTVGVVGAILLLFHVHSGDMRAPHAMETMERIQKQHQWFAGIGLGVAVTNRLAGTSRKWKQFFTKAWPALLIVLGVLLAQYAE